jgi:hypothetical protein
MGMNEQVKFDEIYLKFLDTKDRALKVYANNEKRLLRDFAAIQNGDRYTLPFYTASRFGQQGLILELNTMILSELIVAKESKKRRVGVLNET